LNIKEENQLNITDLNLNKKDNLHNNNINIKANIDNSNLIDDVKDKKFNLDIEIANEIYYDNRKYIIIPKQPKNENKITNFFRNKRRKKHLKKGLFCNNIVKRVIYIKQLYIYHLYKPHSNDCDEIYKTIADKKKNIKLIDNLIEYEIIDKWLKNSGLNC
jgi:hypothetical protein